MGTLLYRRNVIFLILIFALALGLRIGRINNFFSTADDLGMVVYVLDSIPDKPGWSSFLKIEGGALENPLRLFGFPLGALQPILLFATALGYTLLKIPITEFTWTLPVILLGSITIFPLYLLVKRLSNPRAGIMAAILLAVLPIHTMESRSLAAAWAVSFLLQILVIYYFVRYLEERQNRELVLASGLLATYLLADNQFLSILPLLFYIGFIYQDRDQSASRRGLETLKIFRQPRFFLLPLTVLIGLLALHLTFTYFRTADFSGVDTGVGSLSHILKRNTQAGFYCRHALEEVIENIGWPLFIFILAMSVLGVFDLKRNFKFSIFLIWGLCYLLPFFFFISPRSTLTRGYLAAGIYPLAVFSAIILTQITSRGKYVLQGAFYIVVILTLALNFSATYGITFSSFLALPPFQGSVSADNGAKTAGFWIRQNTAAGDSIFTFNLPPKVMRYYARRRCFGQLKGNQAELFYYFQEVKDKISCVVVGNKNPVRELLSGAGYHQAVRVKNGETTLLLIYTRREIIPPVLRETTFYNRRFNQLYSNLSHLTGMPRYVSRDGIKSD